MIEGIYISVMLMHEKTELSLTVGSGPWSQSIVLHKV